MMEKGEVNPMVGSVLFVSSDIVGRGESHELGSLLMQKFLHEVGWHHLKPETIVLMNNGVKLATGDSLVVGELKQLENKGVDILSCGTCLSRLELTAKVAVGKVSNMTDITNILLRAEKVISL